MKQRFGLFLYKKHGKNQIFFKEKLALFCLLHLTFSHYVFRLSESRYLLGK